MSPSIEAKLANYARRCNLMDQDVEFVKSLILQTEAEEREECAKIADVYFGTTGLWVAKEIRERGK